MTRKADGQTREELVAGYAHPYRRWLPVAYRLNRVGVTLIASATLAAATAGLAETRGLPDWSVALVVLFLLVSLAWAGVVTVQGVIAIRERTRTWHADEASELDAVRRNRPHAGDADAGFAHDEYAVSVEDGQLVTWCFMPLDASQGAVDDEVLIPGTPSYAAAPVERLVFDARDTARAAEQLVDAQTTAAEWEAEAAHEEKAAWAAREEARELLRESASTGAALRRQTGQDRR